MSRKTGANVSVCNVQSEQEWTELCERQGGLTIVDIYSDWAGPCTAMAGALKKIKLEVGDDSLMYAMARSDSIPALQMFQGQCKPTYLFIASGKPVAVMHGANAPLMKTMVADQMELERRVQAGEMERTIITLEEAVPELDEEEEEANDEDKADPSSKMEWLDEMKNDVLKKEESGEQEETNLDNGQSEGDKIEESQEIADSNDIPLNNNTTETQESNDVKDEGAAETTEAKNDFNNNDEN